MNDRNDLIISKIISEITTYLLFEKINKFNFNVSKLKTQYYIELTINKITTKQLFSLNAALTSGRDHSLESYGWTLVGEGTLDMIGAFIDLVTVEYDKNLTLIKIIRNI